MGKFNVDFKEPDVEPILGQGKTLLENEEMIKVIQYVLKYLSDFVYLREMAVYVTKIDEIKTGAS